MFYYNLELIHPVDVLIIALQLFRLSYVVLLGSTEILVTATQPPKAPLPMLVTLAGIVMLVIFEHPENAEAPMLVTLEAMVTLVRLVHP